MMISSLCELLPSAGVPADVLDCPDKRREEVRVLLERNSLRGVEFVIQLLFFVLLTGAQSSAAELELIARAPGAGELESEFVDALLVPRGRPHEILFATRNQGAVCGFGAPVTLGKIFLDAATGAAVAIEQIQALPLIEGTESLFESSEGTLFIGGGWCGFKPPHYSMDGGESWRPATKGMHPPGRSDTFVEFQGSVFLGTGYDPHPAQIYRWLGADSPDHWQLVLEVPLTRSIFQTASVHRQELFFGSDANHGACRGSAPVWHTSDGNRFVPTKGLDPCHHVSLLLDVGDRLVAISVEPRTGRALSFLWHEEKRVWVEVGSSTLENVWSAVSHGGFIYFIKPRQPGIFRSADLGLTGTRVAELELPALRLHVHGDDLYVGTHRGLIYRLALDQVE